MLCYCFNAQACGNITLFIFFKKLSSISMSRPLHLIILLGLENHHDHYVIMKRLETSEVYAVMIFDLAVLSLRRFDNIDLVHWDLRG